MNEVAVIQSLIHNIRGHKVMLDSDLAKLYEIEVKRLNEAVKRNINRFPPDFMFQLTEEEYANLKSQIATSSWGGRRTLPYAFSEHGVLMLSSVLNSKKAIDVNITIMRTFVEIRQYMLSQANNNLSIEDVKQMLLLHIENTENNFNQHNDKINQIVRTLNNMIEHPKPKRRIGFVVDRNDEDK